METVTKKIVTLTEEEVEIAITSYAGNFSGQDVDAFYSINIFTDDEGQNGAEVVFKSKE